MYGECLKGFSVTHLNIRSIKNKLNELKIMMNSLKPQVFSLSETWLSPNFENSPLTIGGYDLYRCDRTTLGVDGTLKTGGGLATYVSCTCTVDSTKYSNLEQSNNDVELQILTINRGQDKGAVIINTYRPPRGNPSTFLDILTNILSVVTTERYRDIYVLGDLNLDHLPTKQNECTRNLLSMMKTHGFKQVIKKPTRRTIKTQSLIDVLYIRTQKKVTPLVLSTSISDHFLIGCTRYLNYTPDTTTSFYGRTYRNYSFEAASDFYSTIDRSHIYQLTDVDAIWSILKGFILKCVNHLCPNKKITTKLEQPEWITTYIIEIISDRDSKFNEAYETASPSVLAEARVLRTQVRWAIRNARAEFIKNQLHDAGNNPRKFWEEINKLLHRKTSGSKIILHDEDDKLVNQKDAPSYINSFFSNIGPNLAVQFNSTPAATISANDSLAESNTCNSSDGSTEPADI